MAPLILVFNDLCVHIKVQRPSCTSQKNGVAVTVYRAGGGGVVVVAAGARAGGERFAHSINREMSI